MLKDAGFDNVRVEEKVESREFIKDWMPGSGAEDYVVSANVTAGPGTRLIVHVVY
jgi:arsenite methyltransferase